MIVTAVERRRGPRSPVRVYIDGGLALVMPLAQAQHWDIHPGRVFEPAEWQAIVHAEARRETFDAAARMLARRPHSEREVRQKLARVRRDASLVDEAIARLTALGAIDDADFARVFTETRDRTSPSGRRLVVAELRARGVAPEAAATATAALDEDDAAYGLAQKRARSLVALEYRDFRDRLAAHLQRRGFGWDTIRSTVDRCWREAQGDTAADHDRAIEYAG